MSFARYNGINLPNSDDFKIDFYDVEYPMTIQDQILQNDFELKNNLTTQAHIMMKNNKDLSMEDAIEQIAQNKEINMLLMGDFEEDTSPNSENIEQNQENEENEAESND